MSYNFSKAFLTFSVSALLVAASVTASDARSHSKRQAPPEDVSTYSNWERGAQWEYTSPNKGDNSCFRSLGLPEMYACSPHGG